MAETSVVNELAGASGELRGDMRGPGWDFVCAAAWLWYRDNAERAVCTVHKWIFHFTIKVSNLEGLFVALFGPPPAGI